MDDCVVIRCYSAHDNSSKALADSMTPNLVISD